MLDNWPECKTGDTELLKNGRMRWYKTEEFKKILAIIGRNKDDNEQLEKLAQKGDIVLQLKDVNGPTTLIRGINLKIFKDIRVDVPVEYSLIDQDPSDKNQIIKCLAIITAYYAVKIRGKKVVVSIKSI